MLPCSLWFCAGLRGYLQNDFLRGGKGTAVYWQAGKRIVELCLAQTGFSPEETVVVGDRLYTDIACGINGKVDTALVFTGEAQPQDLQDTPYKPTWCYADVQAMVREVEEF